MNLRRPAAATTLVLALALGATATPLASWTRTAHAQDGEEEPPQNAAAQKAQALTEKGVKALQAEKFDEGIAEFKKILALLEGSKGQMPEEMERSFRYLAEYNMACGYSLKKEKKDALDWFEKSVMDGFVDWAHIDSDTDLDFVRSDARFKEIIEKGRENIKKHAKERIPLLLAKDALFPYQLSFRPLKSDKKILGSELLGKVVLVDIFADVEGKGGAAETPDLVAIHKDYKDKGVEVTGLVAFAGGEGEEAKDAAAKVVERLSLPYPVGIANRTQLERARVTADRLIPMTLVLDKQGKLRARLVGADRNGDTMRALVDTLLAEKSDAKPMPEGDKNKGDGEKKSEDKKSEDKKPEDKKPEDKKQKDPAKKDDPI